MAEICGLCWKGKLKPPIITKYPEFVLEGCQIRILHPRRRWFNKIQAVTRMFPYSFRGYLGTIQLRGKVRNKTAAEHKTNDLLTVEAIGRFTSEGMGLVDWERAWLEKSPKKSRRRKSIKIRKGLPQYLSKALQQLIQYALLHDFVHTSRHESKIYQELPLVDKHLLQLLKMHHEETDYPIIRQFQYYDQSAAMMTRRVRSPRANRYTWASKDYVDFQTLASQLAEANHKGVWYLYKFVYENKELEQLSESLQYGHSSLKTHILLIVNLIVLDFQHGKFGFSQAS